jgi:DNA-binding SARP family transcriptional activator/regulation of enolase protein 1 (concanavalin A-like superfamily)
MSQPDPPDAPLTIRLLGPLEARVRGAPLPHLRTRKGAWLLAFLTLRAVRSSSRASHATVLSEASRGGPGLETSIERAGLAGTLWPESGVPQALESLRKCLKDLRRALGSEAWRLTSPTRRLLALDLSGAVVDLLAFDAAIARGDSASLTEAVALYAGPLLEGCLEEWAFQERRVREEFYLAALEQLAGEARARGDTVTAERLLRRAVAMDPLRESAQRALMQALAEGGSYGAALEVYRELRLRLYRELNASPDPETQALFQQLRAEVRQRGQGGSGRRQPLPLAGKPMAAVYPPAGERAPPPRPAISEGAAEEVPLFVLQRALASAPMVGRAAELGTLERQLEAVAQGRGGTLFLAGEPGIGKTRLAVEAAEAARERGFLVLSGHCDEEGAAPYQPFGEALRQYLEEAEPEQIAETLPSTVAGELVRLVPRLRTLLPELSQAPLAAGEQARQVLLEAVCEFCVRLTRHSPVLLFLDDLHWADEASLVLLHHLAWHGRKMHLLILGTYRDVELRPEHALERTLSMMNRERLSQCLSLPRLPEAAAAELLATRLAVPSLPPAFVSALYRETEGNPFFLEEVLKHLVEEGAICMEGGVWQIKPFEELRVPPSVKVTIGRRLQRLAVESRETLTLAAMIGPQFPFELLLAASGVGEERLLEIVEEWLGAHLVVEQRLGREEVYRFQHALIRDVLYEGVTLRRRARLHERVGWALEAVYPAELEEHLEELAHHFAQARSGAAMEKGVDYFLRAREKARSLYASEKMIQHLTAALELLDRLPADELHLRKRWEAVYHLRGAYLSCQAFERGQEVLLEYRALAERAHYPWGVAAVHHVMAGGLPSSESAYRFRQEQLEKVLQIAEAYGLAGFRARARLQSAVNLLGFENDPARAEALLRAAPQAPEGLPRVEAQETYGSLMVVCAWQGKWDEVGAAFRQSIPFGGPDLGQLMPILALATMEDALVQAGKRAQFIAFCEELRALYAQAGLPLPCMQLYLQPAAPSEAFRRVLFRDEFEGPELRPEWQWYDPAQVSQYSLSDRSGWLTLRAGPFVDMWPGSNLNAPRVLCEVWGDFALETKTEGDWDKPDRETGGLLIWKDALNYMRLDKYPIGWHRGSIRLEARTNGEYRCWGRGLLPGSTFHLRLERTEERFAALCSIDGVHWLTCGYVVLSAKDPLRVGVWSGARWGEAVPSEGPLRVGVWVQSSRGIHFDYVQLLGRGEEHGDTE